MYKTKIIVFEGGDCCGKTSLLEATYDELMRQGLKVAKFKFPVYDGVFGKEILDHLKNWDISAHSEKENLDELEKFSKHLYINKLTAFTDFLNLAKDKDFVLVDRFVLSQYIYDKSWSGVFEKTLDNKVVLDRALNIARAYFTAFPEVYTFVVLPNDYVKVMSRASSDRRVDQYDKLDKYQSEVSANFKCISSLDSRFIGFELLGKKSFVINSDENLKALIKFDPSLNTEEYVKSLTLTDDITKNIELYKTNSDKWIDLFKTYTKQTVEFIIEGVNNYDK